MISGLFVIARMVLVVILSPLVASEIISDLTTSSKDESKALALKRDQFWQPLLEAAEKMQIPEHLKLCNDAEKIIAELPAENDYVRAALLEVTQRLRHANEALLRQAVESTGVVEEKLSKHPATDTDNVWSGSDLFSRAIRHFVGEGTYFERLAQGVADRQRDILPVLRGTAEMTGSVLEDCRLSSKRAFDALKYDIYNKGVPKTPQSAKDLAHKLVDASGKTRTQFTGFVMTMVAGITNDATGKGVNAATTVVHGVVQGIENVPQQQSEEQLINL